MLGKFIQNITLPNFSNLKIVDEPNREKFKIQKGTFLEKTNLLLLSLVAFSLPFDFKITSFLLILFGIFKLLHFYLVPRKIPRISIYFAIPSLAYYLLYCISFFYSSDKLTSFHDLETKFSLLALPLLILCMSSIKKNELRLIFLSFIGGLFFFELISLLLATHIYIKTGESHPFFYHKLVEISDINAVYFSWYVLFSMIILLFFELKLHRNLVISLLLFQVIYLFLLSSRAMEMCLIFLLIPYGFYRYIQKKPEKKKAFILFTSSYALVLIFLIWSPGSFNKRLENIDPGAVEQAFLPSYNHHSYDFNNINTRLFFWRVGMDNLKKINLFTGVGNGDVNYLQNHRMHELGILNIFNKEKPSDFFNMNLHNMYLQSLIAIGILGLLFLLYMSILPISLALERANPVMLLFHLIGAVFMIHESALQTQAGVVFFSFFSMLLINQTIHQALLEND